MKVGIMTMHRIPNYGSFMQAFSLKKMVESLGHEVVFVDFKVEPDVEHKDSLKHWIICEQKQLAKYIRSTKWGDTFYRWIKQNSVSKDIVQKQTIFSSCNNLLGVTRKYSYRTKVDVLIIGSDEVFNCTQKGFNIGYSLELFGKNCRANRIITYAASFGNTTYSKLSDYNIILELQKLFYDMNAISVRDENSAYIIKRLCNKIPERHLDPVLVGNVERNFECKPSLKNFIILYGYMYRFTKEECERIRLFAHERNKIVVAIGEPQYVVDEYICCKPDEVLGYFKKADYVITDTFHGTIFSVIMHKKFLTVVRSSLENTNGNEEKLDSLLNDLNLRSRRLVNFADINKIDDDIDFIKVDKIREKERKRTLEYLKNNIC